MNYVFYLLFVTVLPVLVGALAVTEEDGGAYAVLWRWCVGFVMMLGAAWLPACAGIFLGMPLNLFTAVWMIIVLIFAAGAAYRMYRAKEKPLSMITALFKGWTFAETAAFILPAIHAAVTFFMMHIDDDDVAYVGAVTTAVDTNTLMKFDAVNGNLIIDFAKNEMNRLVAAPQFAFYGAVSKMFHIRPAVLCHTFMPPVLTMLFYTAFLLAGYEMLGRNRKKAGIFTVFVFLINMSSYFSVYTAGTFLMIRSWQGKAQIVGLIFPLLFALFFRMSEREGMNYRDTAVLTAILAAACLLTSMGAVFACGAAVILILLQAVRQKAPRMAVRMLPAFVIPAAMLFVYYIIL